MDAVVVPEPTPEERQAVLEALADRERDPYDGAWRRASLTEGVETEEP